VYIIQIKSTLDNALTWAVFLLTNITVSNALLVVIHASTNENLLWSVTTLEKMLGCFNPILGQIWTNSNVGLKI